MGIGPTSTQSTEQEIGGRHSEQEVVFNLASATGVGQVLDVYGYRHIQVCIATAGSATMSFNAYASIGKAATTTSSAGTIVSNVVPSFGSARSTSNMWDTVALTLINGGGTAVGNSGLIGSAGQVAAAGTDFCSIYEAELNGAKYFTVGIPTYSSGSATCICMKLRD